MSKRFTAQPGEVGGFIVIDEDGQPVDGPFFSREEAATEATYRNQKARRNENRQAKNEAMQSLGLVKVRGAQGGVYWE